MYENYPETLGDDGMPMNEIPRKLDLLKDLAFASNQISGPDPVLRSKENFPTKFDAGCDLLRARSQDRTHF